MADINIERKSGSSAVWWIVGIVVAVIILWALFSAGWNEPVTPAM